jgi:hypothetical protein
MLSKNTSSHEDLNSPHRRLTQSLAIAASSVWTVVVIAHCPIMVEIAIIIPSLNLRVSWKPETSP